MEARCYKHPDEDALYQCSFCGRLICADCMVFADDEEDVRCPECTLETAIRMSEEDAADSQKKTRERQRRSSSIRVKQPSAKRWDLPVKPGLMLLFLAMAFLNFFLSWCFQVRKEELVTLSNPNFVRLGNPASEMVFLASRLFSYQKDHRGSLPEKLEELLPKYIDRKSRILDSEVEYGYRLDQKEGFELSCPIPTKYRFHRLALRKDGILQIQ